MLGSSQRLLEVFALCNDILVKKKVGSIFFNS